MDGTVSAARLGKKWAKKTKNKSRQPTVEDYESDTPQEMQVSRTPKGAGTNPWRPQARVDEERASKARAIQSDLANIESHSELSKDEIMRPYERQMQHSTRPQMQRSVSQFMAEKAAEDKRRRFEQASRGLDDIPSVDIGIPSRGSPHVDRNSPYFNSRGSPYGDRNSPYSNSRGSPSGGRNHSPDANSQGQSGPSNPNPYGQSPSNNPYATPSSSSSRDRDPYAQRSAVPSSSQHRSPYSASPSRQGTARSASPYSNHSSQSDLLDGRPPVQPASMMDGGSGVPASSTAEPTVPKESIGGRLRLGLPPGAMEPEDETEVNFLLWWDHLQSGFKDLEDAQQRLSNTKGMSTDDRFNLVGDMKATCDDLAPTIRQFRDLIGANITPQKLAEYSKKFNLEPQRDLSENAVKNSKLLQDIDGLRMKIVRITKDVDEKFKALHAAQLKETDAADIRMIEVICHDKSEHEKKAALERLRENPETFISDRIHMGERLTAAKATLSNVQERYALCKQMEETVQLLANLQSELAGHVECQDAQIVAVEQAVEESVEYVEKANTETDKSIEKAKKKYKKKWICFGICAAIIAILAGVLCLYFLVIKKKQDGGGGGGGSKDTSSSNSNAAVGGGGNYNTNAGVNQANVNGNHVAGSNGNAIGKRWVA